MRRVLVVDDELQILRALRVVLREAGYEAVPAGTAEEALDRAAVRPPDAAIRVRPPAHAGSQPRPPAHAPGTAALAAGGTDNGAPGVREIYHPSYYGAYVLDPDGNNIEAVCHRPAQSPVAGRSPAVEEVDRREPAAGIEQESRRLARLVDQLPDPSRTRGAPPRRARTGARSTR